MVILTDTVLLVLVALAAYFDITTRKIPNLITFPVMGIGLAINTFIGGFGGLQFSALGLLLGIVLFFIPFALGGMGAGDVKLLGAIGAVQGPAFVFYATLFAILCGGLMALIYMAVNGRLLKILKKAFGMLAVPFFTALYFRFKSPYFNYLAGYYSKQLIIQESDKEKIYMPYGVAIALGTLIVISNLGYALIPINITF